MNKKISIIFGFRNRELIRVERCLQSLQNQSLQNFIVIFIDYGSALKLAIDVKKLVEKYPFTQYIYSDTRGMFWNRSHALNTGIKLAATEYIMTSDIDLIFNPHFLETVSNYLDKTSEIHISAYVLAEKFKNWNNLFNNKKAIISKTRGTSALGLSQTVHKSFLEKIRGFDEFYRIWGVEDNDLNIRLKSLNIKTVWIPLNESPVYHQWHPTTGTRSKTNLPKGWERFLSRYMENNKFITKRNPTDWGTILNKNSRPSLKAFFNNERINTTLNITRMHGLESLIEVHKFFDNLKPGEILSVNFTDTKYQDVTNSKLHKFINYINHWSNKLNLSILFQSDIRFFGTYQSIYEIRDTFAYFLILNKNDIVDYYMDLSKSEITLILTKKK